MPQLEEIARDILSAGKGILAADETPRTLTKRLADRGIESTPESRRSYREIFVTTPGVASFIGGVILQDETIRQKSSKGPGLIDLLNEAGIIPGIKVDNGAHPMAGARGELITEGLDGLRSRLEEYRGMSARFAKWRAVLVIGEGLPTFRSVRANAHALARYAALCQEVGLVPIVEPEVLMDRTHTLERCEEVTAQVLHAVFDALEEEKVLLEGMLLKPNMVVAGQECAVQASVQEVATATVRTLTRCVPPAVAGVVFLSGGQPPALATEHLNAINQLQGRKPWPLSYCYARALQDEALAAWQGRAENVPTSQRAFRRRSRFDSAAALGRYRTEMETEQELTQTAA
jgi:fructose-bisphosphate aldolase class I